MESEMKYALPGPETADAVWQDAEIENMTKPYSDEEVFMRAVYFDTDDMDLADNDIAIRLRAEDDHCFATLKWGGKTVNGHHMRGEINVPVCPDAPRDTLSPEIFRESPQGKMLIDIVGDKELKGLLTTEFTRRRRMVNFNGNLIEMAVDQGSIITPFGTQPISEMELELYVGDDNSIEVLGEKLAERYSLEPENGSKFGRGLAIIRCAAMAREFMTAEENQEETA